MELPAQNPKVLVFVDFYLPGFRFGGILTAVAALVELLGDQIDFSIVTAPHDQHLPERYPNIELDTWNEVGKAKVFYTSGRSVSALKNLFAQTKPDVVYLNSFWSRRTVQVLLLRRLRALSKVPLVLAPRGTLSPGALEIKATKKRVYSALAERSGLAKDVWWHATSDREAADIQRFVKLRDRSKILTAPDLMEPVSSPPSAISRKLPGKLRVVAISRIAPIKNFDFLIAAFRDVRGEVELDLFGPIEDQRHWQTCESEISKLPPNIHVRYAGLVEKTDIANTLAEYDVHALPSKGENFGYSIVEALSMGVPVVISDRTPWHGLEKMRAGFDLPLIRETWTTCLQQLTDIGPDEHEELRRGAMDFYRQRVSRSENREVVLSIFLKAIRTC